MQQQGGWKTLLTILSEAGERPSKRSLSPSSQSAAAVGRVANPHRRTLDRGSANSDSDTAQLAKRVKGVSLRSR